MDVFGVWERLSLTSEELLLNLDRLADDLGDRVRMRPSAEVGEEQARKVGVETLVARDELVGEGEARHEAALLEPEDRGERAREEDALDGGKGDEALGERGARVGDPLESPCGLLLDARDGVDGLEQVRSAGGVLDVRVDEEGVSLGVDVLPADVSADVAKWLRGCEVRGHGEVERGAECVARALTS